MIDNPNQLKQEYDDKGFFVIRNYFSDAEIHLLKTVVLKFHQRWKYDNEAFYREVAFNSSLITGAEYLEHDDRLILFDFISSEKMMNIVEAVIPANPAFMNTQLFFNPVNPQLKDFWHRDCQYDHEVEQQKKAIQETQKKYNESKKVIYRFVGSTASLTDTPNILISILKELGINEEIRKGINLQIMREEVEKLEEFYFRIHNHISSISQETIIFLDAIDQINNEDEFLKEN